VKAQKFKVGPHNILECNRHIFMYVVTIAS